MASLSNILQDCGLDEAAGREAYDHVMNHVLWFVDFLMPSRARQAQLVGACPLKFRGAGFVTTAHAAIRDANWSTAPQPGNRRHQRNHNITKPSVTTTQNRCNNWPSRSRVAVHRSEVVSVSLNGASATSPTLCATPGGSRRVWCVERRDDASRSPSSPLARFLHPLLSLPLTVASAPSHLLLRSH